ncbi:MAG: hypothetical protein J1E64_10940 [Acetatifactor sp.]|nr:hypothetical protein [Acetatifactor sp.]
MKKIISMILLAATVMTLFTGCQKTPDKPVVTQKNQEQMLDAAENGGENSSLLSVLETPERYTGDWTGVNDCVTVHVDAAIELPNAQAIPTGTVSRRSFTQEDADHVLSALIGDNTFYQEQGATKQFAMALLEMYQEILRGERPVSDAGEFVTIEDIPGYIEEWTERLKTLPDESERFLASRTFEPDDYYDEWIRGYAEVDGRTMHVEIYNFQASTDDAIGYVEGYAGGGAVNGSYAIPYNLLEEAPPESISEADARKAAEELIQRMGFTNVVCDESAQIAFIEDFYITPDKSTLDIIDTGYEFEFVRCLDGFPISYTPFQGTSFPENEEYIGPWANERITIDVTKSGVVYFHWCSPYTEPELETKDTQLLAFDDVQDIFKRMIIIDNSYLTEANERNGMRSTIYFDVDKVKLSLMRIRSNGNISEGLIVPVWDFWGTKKFYPDENSEGWEEYTILLTVNAIDGTVISRDFGY